MTSAVVDKEVRSQQPIKGRSLGLSRRRLTPPVVLRFQPGHRVGLFSHGRETFDSMLEAIDNAEHFIHLETYILRADETGRRVLSHLTARAQEGVSVRVIFDALGSRGLDRSVLRPLAEAGASVVEFNPPSQWLWRFRPRQRDHRKMLLVDGRVGFLGGLNIGNEYVAEDADGPTWRDAHIRLEGPALTELGALFIENWFRSGGESFDWRSSITRKQTSTGDRSVAILADGPTYRRRRLRSYFLYELSRARSHVLLVSPYFAPGSKVLDALSAASDRGVRVELLLAGHTDHPILRRAVREIVPKLISCGVRVFEDPRRMMHAKLAVFDDALAVVGTSNLDRQSLQHSCEVNAVIEGHVEAKWILEHFGTDILDVCPIDRAVLERRSLLTRWTDKFASICARL
jgi:cardiolipin synthase